jgi:hypothetical protein
MPLWLYYSFKNKSFTYFCASNPGIETGGFFGESKSEILKLIDPQYLPKSVECNSADEVQIISQLNEKGIAFPFIAKPDVGERGNGVAKIHTVEELRLYNSNAIGKYIIQEYIDYELEFGVFYSRLPNSNRGIVSSVTEKEYLSVTGDGSSTVKELMNKSRRARLQLSRFEIEFSGRLNNVIKKGEKVILEPIGNHCRGTRFINSNHLINEKLNNVFDTIAIDIDGFYYGRFDLKVKSVEDLYLGKNIRILELNGSSSEPGHIYDAERTGLFKGLRDLLWHWQRLAEVSRVSILAGNQPISIGTLFKNYLNLKRKKVQAIAE